MNFIFRFLKLALSYIYICFMFYTIFHQTFQKFDCNLGFVGDYGRTEKYRCSACNSRWRTKIVIWGLRCLWKQLLAENWMHNTQSTCSVCRYSTKIHTIIEKKKHFWCIYKRSSWGNLHNQGADENMSVIKVAGNQKLWTN